MSGSDHQTETGNGRAPDMDDARAHGHRNRWPASPDDLFAVLDGLNIAHRTVSHPRVFSVEEARRHRGEIPGGHTKNLFLKDKKGAMVLLVADEEAAINLKTLHSVLGCQRLSFGRPETLMTHLGVEPGSVTPFAIINDREGRVGVVLDGTLMAHEALSFHPLDNTMTTTIATRDLVAFLSAHGHAPRVVALPQTPPGD